MVQEKAEGLTGVEADVQKLKEKVRGGIGDNGEEFKSGKS